MPSYEPHPFAEIFPLGDTRGPDWDAFRESVCRQQYDQIILYEGKILDGRRRYRACIEGGKEPRLTPCYLGPRDALELSYAKNLQRRNLTDGQRAMAGAAYKEQLDGIGRKLMEEGAAKGGKTAGKGRPKKTDSPEQNSADSQPQRAEQSRAKAAALFDVSHATIDAASKVRSLGTAELVAMVNTGEVAVSAAAKVAALPPQQQREIVQQGPKAVKKVASEQRKHEASERRKKSSEGASVLEDVLLLVPKLDDAEAMAVIHVIDEMIVARHQG